MRNLLVLACLTLFGCTMDNDLVGPHYGEFPPSNPNAVENPHHQDRIMQVVGNPVDVLFIIDKSCSMNDNANNLNQNIPVFFDILDQYNLDYHVGITSTNNTIEFAGQLVMWSGERFITPLTENPETYFAGMNNTAMIFGSGEAGIDAAYSALERQEAVNGEFFRYGVPLHIITITDENDSSIYKTPRQLYNKLWDYWGHNNAEVNYSGILVLPNSESCESILFYDAAGYEYLKVINKMGGLALDICQDDWSAALDELAKYEVETDVSEFFLSQNPIEETIEVHVERGEITFSFENAGDWIYDRNRNSITFSEFLPQADDAVLIDYEVDLY